MKLPSAPTSAAADTDTDTATDTVALPATGSSGRLSRPVWIGGAAVAGVLAIGGFMLAADKPTAPAVAAGATPASVRPALTVTVTAPRRETLPLAVAANGGLFAWQEASVGAEAQGMRLAEVRVNVGDVVRRGQVLAVFDAAMVQADQAQGRAAVAEADALLAEATANGDRARDLGPKGVISAQQVSQLLTAERTAAARVQAQRAALQVLALRVAQAQVLAPDDGVISARGATVGAVVPAGQELFRLIRQGRLEWRAEVAGTDLAALKPGQAVRVVPAGGAAIAGRLRMVGPTVDAGTRNGLVYVDLPAAAAATGARAGMFARGEFDVGQAEALTVPAGAVLLRDGYSYVFTVDAQQRVSQVKVTVGRRVGERVEITSGLQAQARVVAEGAGFLGDGDTVRVVDAPVPSSLPSSLPASLPASAPVLVPASTPDGPLRPGAVAAKS